jgi:DNA modification methylase
MTGKLITENTLFYGDNLPILREYVSDESINLIYLDPPFNSQRTYNVLFKDEGGLDSEAQIAAFEDTWHWTRATEEAYHELVTQAADRVSKMIGALRDFIGTNQMMAYLVMMAVRLVELHRVLKPTGSLYLHCDPTASHYLKLVLDTIFGPANFRNEISWKRSSAHSDTRQGMRRCGKIRDILLFYTKTDGYTWNPVYMPYSEDYLQSEYRHKTPEGRYYKETDVTAAKPGGDTEYEWRVKRPIGKNERWQADLNDEYENPHNGWEYRGVRPYRGRYWAFSKANLVALAESGLLIHRETGMPRLMHFADEMPGVTLQDSWDDITAAMGGEDLGYPTQKPLALLERIIEASSNPGDWVLDPFCGCGTTVVAAQKLDRHWIGIDISHLAMTLQKYRMEDMFPDVQFKVIGEPESLAGAFHLARQNRFQFEWWALSLVRARPTGGQLGSRRGKKGADKGIDGVITFIDEAKGKPKRVLVQVKSGSVSSRDIRDLRGTVEREDAAMGVFITLEPSTAPMEKEAVSAGFYDSPGWKRNYPKIQILTIEELMQGKPVDMPPEWGTFKQARRVGPQAEQPELGL